MTTGTHSSVDEHHPIAKLRPLAAPAALLVAMIVVYANWASNWWSVSQERFDGWGVGDWLISFDGGVVRRGLFGTLILGATPETWHVPNTVVIAQITIMGLLFAAMFGLYLRTSRSMTYAMVILSPATLLFSTTAVSISPTTGPRKEVLVFLALAIVALGFRTRYWHWWGVAGLPVFILAAWSHEITALVLPAFVYLLIRGAEDGSSRNRAWKVALTAIYSTVAALAVIVAIMRPGDAETQQLICAAWAERGIPADCGGQALGALTLTADQTYEWFSTQLFPRYWGYLPIAALSILPLYAVRFLPRHWKPTLVVVLALLPLFQIGWDWGRWIYVVAMTLSILALALGSSATEPRPMRVAIYGIVAYIVLWGFQGYSGEPPVLRDGWLVGWLIEHYPSAWF